MQKLSFGNTVTVKKAKNSISLSGSGPTVFGIFENDKFAENAYNEFKIKYNETFLTKSFNV